MPRLGELKDTYPAGRTAILKPESWISTWPMRPNEDIVVGLRLPSPNDKIFVRVEAKKRAKRYSKDDSELKEIEQDALTRLLVSRCICDPNNANNPPGFLPFPDDMIFDALTDSGVEHLFGEVLKYQVETSQGSKGSIDDAARLMSMLESGALEALSQANYELVIRHLSFACTIIDEELDSVEA